jgi:hypothetical protein
MREFRGASNCGELEFATASLLQSERYFSRFNCEVCSGPLDRRTNDVVLQAFFFTIEAGYGANCTVISGESGKAPALSGTVRDFLSFKNQRQADGVRSENHPPRVYKLS